MQVVILAAGRGQRLHPLTEVRSKAMLPIVGIPMIARVMEQFLRSGLHEFIVVINPADHSIQQHFQHEYSHPVKTRLVFQEEQTGMADALSCAAPYISGNFLLSACDNLVSKDHIRDLIDAHHNISGTDATISLMPVLPDAVSRTGIVELNGLRITGLVEKPLPHEAPTNISSLPLYIFSPLILNYLKDVHLSARGELELQDAIQMLINEGNLVQGVLTDDRLTLTTPADLLNINLHYLQQVSFKSANHSQQISPGVKLIPPYYVEENTRIDRDCTIGPTVFIERDCCINRDTTIQSSVLLRGTEIDTCTSVKNKLIP